MKEKKLFGNLCKHKNQKYSKTQILLNGTPNFSQAHTQKKEKKVLQILNFNRMYD